MEVRTIELLPIPPSLPPVGNHSALPLPSSMALPQLIARTGQSNKSSHRPVRAVHGDGCLTSRQTGLSEQLMGGTICSSLRQASPTSRWTPRCADCSNKLVGGLVGPARPSIQFTQCG
ncbi:hypothetical protein PSTG_06967 [Puccinia striiformis f. sp. tritici PST-78]|uniref:Uncharacterized protein n=1 Tax=Puccinia striiformis f. sp. tritici PST-78 TaxID=1165861 RepID=A0A0L0VKT2_9BASI|nr:hypothetical protein PSTG_06967 [Puccinia striiformis f. sp. tritici PST-78]